MSNPKVKSEKSYRLNLDIDEKLISVLRGLARNRKKTVAQLVRSLVTDFAIKSPEASDDFDDFQSLVKRLHNLNDIYFAEYTAISERIYELRPIEIIDDLMDFFIKFVGASPDVDKINAATFEALVAAFQKLKTDLGGKPAAKKLPRKATKAAS
jgi:hypothetical protein